MFVRENVRICSRLGFCLRSRVRVYLCSYTCLRTFLGDYLYTRLEFASSQVFLLTAAS